MKALKYLFAFWAALVLYASLSLMFGNIGFSAYRQLKREQIRLEANIENLREINRELEKTTNSFLFDEDTLVVHARERGFAAPNERFIRIVGLRISQNTRIFPGDPVFAAEPQYVPERTLKIIAFFMGFSIFLCFAFFDFLKYLKDR